jgi:hypothetical protein
MLYFVHVTIFVSLRAWSSHGFVSELRMWLFNCAAGRVLFHFFIVRSRHIHLITQIYWLVSLTIWIVEIRTDTCLTFEC